MTPAEAIDRMQCPHCGKSLESEQASKVATVPPPSKAKRG
jgi:hypothetical protein